MKKILIVLLSFLMLVSFSCISVLEDEEDKDDDKDKKEKPIEDTKVIDPLLIGDYWFERSSELALKGDGVVYNFTQKEINKCEYNTISVNKKFIAEIIIKAYSKDGNLYSYNDDTIIFSYAIIPFNDFLYQRLDMEKNKIIKITTLDNNESIFTNFPASSFEEN